MSCCSSWQGEWRSVPTLRLFSRRRRPRRARAHASAGAPTRTRPAGRSRSSVAGSKPSASRARAMSAPVSCTSPDSRSRRRTSSGRPAIDGEQLERAGEAHARAAADVVDLAADPAGCGRRQHRGDDVADEGEVARLARRRRRSRSARPRPPLRRSAGTPCRAAGAGRRPRRTAARRRRRRARRGRAGTAARPRAWSRRTARAAAGWRPRAWAAPPTRRRPTTRRRRRSAAPAPAPTPRAAAAWRGCCCAGSGRSFWPQLERTPGSAARWKTTSQPSSSASTPVVDEVGVDEREAVVLARADEVGLLVLARVVVGEAVDRRRPRGRRRAAPRRPASR